MFNQRLLNPRVAVIAGCLSLIVMGTLPVLFSFPDAMSFKLLEGWPMLRFAGQGFVILSLLGIIFLIAKMDSMPTPMKFFLYGGFLLLAVILTDLHWQTVDTVNQVITPGRPQINLPKFDWQINQYVRILRGQENPPHQYRFLPHGILWWIFLLSGNFRFAYNMYRALFTFAVCLSLYKLSRMYNSHKDSLVVVFLYAVLYPLSVRYYYGNILDPMFHSIFFMALMYCQKRKMPEFFLLVTMGMFVKETIILVVPCYYLLNMDLPLIRKEIILKLGLLAGWCLALFLACRIPFGFCYNNQTLNGVGKLMIMDNLGLSGVKILIPVWVRYMHPILFIFIWIGILILYRKFISRPLFYTAIYLSVSIFLTNLCFGWNYESRNFIPAFGMLAVCAVSIFNQMKTQPAEL